MANADRPPASQLQTPNAQPGVVGNPDDFIDRARGARLSVECRRLSVLGQALLGLHVASFSDAMLVTLHWLHIACDALGFKPRQRAGI
ncbi:hypothetical protein DL771_003501 [Monosporascus sp. 5C6A]|nr:hypothetical protein DL771_003501 [Monosporascus sp. 5C6A]